MTPAELIPRWGFYAIPWAVALLVAALAWLLRRHLGPVRSLGIGLMTVPVTDTLVGIIESFGPLLRGGIVLASYSTYQLSRLYSYKLLADLGYLGVGFLLYAGGARFWRQTPQTLARRLADLGFPMGGRGEGRSAFIGLLGFPALLVGTVSVNLLTAGLESLRQSDESSVFANMTVYHAFLISAAAAFGEELVYRGLMQTALLRALGADQAGRSRAARTASVALAILVQAVVFGFAHSGYATWIHVLLPTLFGLVAGFAAWRFGIWSAIVLHFVVDVFAFLSEVGARHPSAFTVLNVLFIANLVLSIGWSIAWFASQTRKPTPP